MTRHTIPVSATEIRFQNGTSLTTHGLAGQATQLVPDAAALRGGRLPAESDTTPEFDRALREAGFVEQETIHLDVAAAPSRLRGSSATTAVTLHPAVPPGDPEPRVVLYQDESGGLSWHFEEEAAAADEPPATSTLRNSQTRRAAQFTIPLRSKQVGATLTRGLPHRSLRGPITTIGRKLLKVFIVPVSNLIARPVDAAVGVIERRVRQNIIWPLTSDTYATSPTAPFDQWQRLRGGRTLLVIHGILSTVEGMLSRLPKSAMERWSEAYDGRVLGFNHHSITLSPEDNARFLMESIKTALPGESLDIDIICHSRGGIVARTLVELGRELFPEVNCRFGRVFFVATPNQGSALGNAEHIVDMIDVFTNALTNFPDGPVLYSIEVILGMVKLVAMAAGTHLPGVAAMGTNGYIKTVLNANQTKSPAKYAAAASDYTPAPGSDNAYLLWRFADAVVDRVFNDGNTAVANDLVVPLEGVFSDNGHPSFPIADPLLFKDKDAVWHCGFFAHAETIRAIDRHLGIASDAPAVGSVGRGADAGTTRSRRKLRGPAPAGATEPVSLASDVVQREPSIEFHEQVDEGDTWPLEVELRESAGADALSVLFAPGLDEVTVSAEISAPGFRVEGVRHVPLTVHRSRRPDTENATFRLTALNPGPEPLTREIVVTFWQDNNAVGTVSHRTVVVPKGYAQSAPMDGSSKTHALRLSSRRRESPDIVVYLRQLGAGQDLYALSMRSVIDGAEYEDQPFGTFALDGSDMATYFSQAIDPVFRAFPSGALPDAQFDAALKTWNENLLTDLTDLGVRLWLLLPKEFRAEYLRLMNLPNPPRSLCIHSDEMIFPWELVRPSGVVDGTHRQLPALGVSHILGRWKVGLEARPQPQAIPNPRVALLNPAYTNDELPWSEDERVALKKMLPGVEVITPVTRRAMTQLLARADVHLVHFTGHGDWDNTTNADLSALRLEGTDSIKAMGFAGSRLGAEGHPILCLNACTIGRTSRVIGRPGGFAANCLESGWSGVLASYWPVYDPKAYEFSLLLYEKLKFGRSIGEALQEIRSDRQDDPTALSYSYFGDPFTRLLFV
jgi:hypothetical protein